MPHPFSFHSLRTTAAIALLYGNIFCGTVVIVRGTTQLYESYRFNRDLLFFPSFRARLYI